MVSAPAGVRTVRVLNVADFIRFYGNYKTPAPASMLQVNELLRRHEVLLPRSKQKNDSLRRCWSDLRIRFRRSIWARTAAADVN